MKTLRRSLRGLYDRVLVWSAHPRAVWLLGGVSALEAVIFPVPPDVMLMPMCLARPHRAWRFALVTTLTSVAGALVGYGIGYFAGTGLEQWLLDSAYADTYLSATEQFRALGLWFILLAGFTPIPFKVFTVTAGLMGVPLPLFVIGALIGRGARFFLEAGLIRLGGPRGARWIRDNIELLGWLMVLTFGLWLIWRWLV